MGDAKAPEPKIPAAPRVVRNDTTKHGEAESSGGGNRPAQNQSDNYGEEPF